MTVFGRVRLLPLVILVALLSFSVRIAEFYAGWRSGVALAQEEVKVNPPEFPAPAAPKTGEDSQKAGEEPAKADSIPGEPQSASTPAASATAPAAPDEKKDTEGQEPIMLGGPPGEGGWTDSSDSEMEYSSVKMELFEDLKKRRKALEEKEKQLATREALLKAGERELDQKYRELTVLKKEIEGLLQKQSEEEQGRIKSLVTIYENMKPKEAARVFDTLDMDVLVSILSRMAERKASPVLAEMNPERARAVTIILAQEKQLPTMPGDLIP